MGLAHVRSTRVYLCAVLAPVSTAQIPYSLAHSVKHSAVLRMTACAFVRGESIGPFVLGMGLWEALQWTRENSLQARTVRILTPSPGEGDELKEILVEIMAMGLQLAFNSNSQRLFRISATPDTVGLSSLRYAGANERFGLTFPGHLTDGCFILEYTGFALLFPLQGELSSEPLSDTLLSRIVVFKGRNTDDIDRFGNPEIKVKVCLGKGLRFDEKEVSFGDSAQRVLLQLGAPTDVYTPPAKDHGSGKGHSSYIFNYFALGVDIVFDGDLHQAIKFKLHTNIVDRPNFNLYNRCQYSIDTPDGSIEAQHGVRLLTSLVY